MPTIHWNFLDQDLLKWWMNRDNLSQVVEYFHIVRLVIEPQVCFLAAQNATQKQKKQLLQIIDEMYLLKENFNREKWIGSITSFTTPFINLVEIHSYALLPTCLT
ncbi:hypothetical protein [Photorhabdus laumondii]|nr:hypothetical protein [Photorhabdus laumondii]